MKEVENIGAIAKTSIADGWVEMPREPDIYSDTWSRTYTLSFDPSVELIFFSRGAAVDPSSAKYFQELCESKPGHHREEKLTPQEIIRLQVIMGVENAGNNQYTNSQPAGEPNGPAFDLKEASCRRVGDRTVLQIKGKFAQGKHYVGIFFHTPERNSLLFEEVIMQAPSSRKLQDNIHYFDQAVNNIEWLAPVRQST